ncbi:MAG TPA: PhzF family phenazine biosynthesis protein [Kofleriaceae bacterium]|nr:PhzF family phenazine biosynthesis protein [Kofleriaceae bacterium]
MDTPREIRCARVSAFTRDPFAGNPAAVCPLAEWLPDELMQRIAAENNLSETAFFVARADGDLDLRWFTPSTEVDLCGHATLASAMVLMERIEPARTSARFHTRSGPLTVERAGGDGYSLDLPSRPPAPTHDSIFAPVTAALGRPPVAVLAARDLLAVFETAAEVRALTPDMGAVARLDSFALCVTAPGTGGDHDVDFVSRFFAPARGVPEDPVTGSAHSTLTPYWSERLGRARLRARQVGPRGGELLCDQVGDRVRLTGHAVLVLDGVFYLP